VTAPAERASQRLAALGLTLPPVTAPLAAYVPAVRTGSYVYVSGQLPLVDGKLQATGKVGASVSVEEAAALARICALNGLAAAAGAAGGLDAITRLVKVTCFVASDPSFTGQAQVATGWRSGSPTWSRGGPSRWRQGTRRP
jgi:enamine deaminase RidA (YjgF/YER057c/UK114 family)